MVPITYQAYRVERSFLLPLLRRTCRSLPMYQATMRYAAIYVIGWGCS